MGSQPPLPDPESPPSPPSGHGGPTVLRLRLDDTEPPNGTVEVEDIEGASLPFAGWVELMAAINECRANNHPFR